MNFSISAFRHFGKASWSRFKKHLILPFFLLPLFTLPACTFLYIPPLRESLEAPESISLEGSRGLYLQSKALRLRVQLTNVPAEGWLNVQWFSDANDEVASDAKWISSDDAGFGLIYNLPANIELKTGTWRAVVSFEGKFLRQFSLNIE